MKDGGGDVMKAPGPGFELGDRARAEVADLLDRQLSPLGLAAIDALPPEPGQAILDIGCGAGETLLQLAERIGPTGRVIGVDIGPHVLAVARARAAHVPRIELMQADAATLLLPNGTVDAVYSRFGVMALDDPVTAFANFRRMTRPGGRLAFVCWRSLAENELDLVPLEAAALDMPVDTTPFKFERREFLRDVLARAGYGKVRIEALDAAVPCGPLDAAVAVLTRVGPLGRILREEPALRSAAEPKVRAALASWAQGGRVVLKAATWIVTATA